MELDGIYMVHQHIYGTNNKKNKKNKKWKKAKNRTKLKKIIHKQNDMLKSRRINVKTNEINMSLSQIEENKDNNNVRLDVNMVNNDNQNSLR